MATLCAKDNDKWGCNQWVNEGKAILQPITSSDNTIFFEPRSPDGAPRIYPIDGVAPTLNTMSGGQREPCVAQPIALAENTIGRQPQNGGNGDGFTEGGPMYTLNATGVHGVAQPMAFAFDSLSSNSMKSKNPISGCNEVDVSKTLDTLRGLDPSCNQGGIAIAQPTIVHGTQDPCHSDIAFAQGRNNGGENVLVQAMHVRRLTPIECERLQGFGDNYTNIKEKCPDGPRYKALGNSMAVPVMAWIGKRIQEVEEICKQNKHERNAR